MEDGSYVIFTDNHGEKQDDYVGYFTLGKDDKMGKKEELTQEEKDLIGLMLEMGFEKDDVFAVCAFSQETEVRKKLLKYLLFKGLLHAKSIVDPCGSRKEYTCNGTSG